MVHLFSRSARPLALRYLAIGVSKLGNGWIYLILLPLVLLRLGWGGWHVVLLAALNAALLHMLYPVIKRRFRRKRPFHVDDALPSLLKTLDEHSFPSGHAMTITGVLAPIVLAWPAMTVSAVVIVLSMGWSRVATAHHYPTDVIAGVALATALSVPLSSWALSFF
jgi:undecaprenyl-diphosphatase